MVKISIFEICVLTAVRDVTKTVKQSTVTKQPISVQSYMMSDCHTMWTCAESTEAGAVRVLPADAGWCCSLPTLRVQPPVQLLQVVARPGARLLPGRTIAPHSTRHQQLQGFHVAPGEQRLALRRALLPAGNRCVALTIIH